MRYLAFLYRISLVLVLIGGGCSVTPELVEIQQQVETPPSSVISIEERRQAYRKLADAFQEGMAAMDHDSVSAAIKHLKYVTERDTAFYFIHAYELLDQLYVRMGAYKNAREVYEFGLNRLDSLSKHRSNWLQEPDLSTGDNTVHPDTVLKIQAVGSEKQLQNDSGLNRTPIIRSIFEDLKCKHAVFRETGTRVVPTLTEGLSIVGGDQALQKQIQIPDSTKAGYYRGSVRVAARVSEEGTVTATYVERTSGIYDYDRAAMEAILKTTFEPARRGDLVFAVWVTTTIDF